MLADRRVEIDCRFLAERIDIKLEQVAEALDAVEACYDERILAERRGERCNAISLAEHFGLMTSDAV